MTWDVFDFAVFAAMLAAVGVIYTLTARATTARAYRWAVGVALAAAFLLVWVNAAVGIIGNEANDANLMYLGVLAVGIIGAVTARFRPDGMARACYATACAQVLVGMVALIGGLGSTGPAWPWDVLFLTGFFAMLWLISGRLFRSLS